MADILDAVVRMYARNYSGSGNWLDESGNSHDAVITGAAFTDAGASSYFTFDGISDEMLIADHADLDMNLTDAWTIGVGIRATDYTPSGTETLLIKVGNTTNYELDMPTTNGPRVLIFESGNLPLDQSGTVPSNGTDSTAIGVRNIVDDDIECFVDGSGNGGAADVTTGSAAGGGSLAIGSGVSARFFAGRVFSMCVIRSALTDAEVVTLADHLLNQTVPASSFGQPVGWGFVRMGT